MGRNATIFQGFSDSFCGHFLPAVGAVPRLGDRPVPSEQQGNGARCVPTRRCHWVDDPGCRPGSCLDFWSAMERFLIDVPTAACDRPLHGCHCRHRFVCVPPRPWREGLHGGGPIPSLLHELRLRLCDLVWRRDTAVDLGDLCARRTFGDFRRPFRRRILPGDGGALFRTQLLSHEPADHRRLLSQALWQGSGSHHLAGDHPFVPRLD